MGDKMDKLYNEMITPYLDIYKIDPNVTKCIEDHGFALDGMKTFEERSIPVNVFVNMSKRRLWEIERESRDIDVFSKPGYGETPTLLLSLTYFPNGRIFGAIRSIPHHPLRRSSTENAVSPEELVSFIQEYFKKN
jgi:hypothetical protein